MKHTIRIGTRGSKLALAQAEIVKKELQNYFPQLKTELVIIVTKGDKILDKPLAAIGDKGLFIREIESALLNDNIDIAVHSCKDLPTEITSGLEISAVLTRADARDVLVSQNGMKLQDLPDGSIIGTSSARRKAQLLSYNRNFVIKDIRGNIDTRIKKLESGGYDAIVLAAAGLIRGGFEDKITQYLDPKIMLPAVSQGAIAIQSRSGDEELQDILSKINDRKTFIECETERRFLRLLEGGCQVPIGCFSKIQGEQYTLTGLVSGPEGQNVIRESVSGRVKDAPALAEQLFKIIIKKGGKRFFWSKKTGTVYLVGAGPGDPGLITVKGLDILKKVDVLVFDYLVSGDILKMVPQGVERIYVGKKAGRHTLKQEEINRLLVAKAKEGKNVARLKGGDPFIFGRGGEEALFLAEHSVPFEVVPGVTAAVAASAYAGIPFTHRGVTASAAFITGHEDPDKDTSLVDYSKFAQGIGTLAFYMGMKNLPVITENLIKHGRSADTPAAVIRWGTYPRQETVTGTLGTIAGIACKKKIRPPAMIIIGEVVGLREQLQWFENKPLHGTRIVVTRSREVRSVLAERLKSAGAEIIEFPTIKIERMNDYSQLHQTLESIDTYSWIVFTSPRGVEYFFHELKMLGKDSRIFGAVKFAVIGRGTAQELAKHGITADLIPGVFTSEKFVDAFKKAHIDLEGKKILFPCSTISREILPNGLKEQGGIVDAVPVYNTVEPEYSTEDVASLFDKKPDMFTFTSSSTVTNLIELVKKMGKQDVISRIKGISIGPVTSETMKNYGITCLGEAGEHTIDGLFQAITLYFT